MPSWELSPCRNNKCSPCALLVDMPTNSKEVIMDIHLKSMYLEPLCIKQKMLLPCLKADKSFGFADPVRLSCML